MTSIGSNFSVIFVNGVGNSYEQASKLAETMAKESKVKIELEHNPCLLTAVFYTVPETEKVIQSLSGRIRYLVDLNKKILIIAHSFGAYITYRALQRAMVASLPGCTSSNIFMTLQYPFELIAKIIEHEEKVKRLVAVHSFGGVCLIPRNIGKRVVNYKVTSDNLVCNLCVSMFQDEQTWCSVENSGKKDEFEMTILSAYNPNNSFWENLQSFIFTMPCDAHTFKNFYMHTAICIIKYYYEKTTYSKELKEIDKQIEKLKEYSKVISFYKPHLSKSVRSSLYIQRKNKCLEIVFRELFDKVNVQLYDLKKVILSNMKFRLWDQGIHLEEVRKAFRASLRWMPVS